MITKKYTIAKKVDLQNIYEKATLSLDEKIDFDDLGKIFVLMLNHRGYREKIAGDIEVKSEEKKKEEGKVEGGIKALNISIDQSNSRTIFEYTHKMYLKAEVLYKEGKWHNPEEPFDERSGGIFHLSRGIRRGGRYTSREMFETHFDLMWTCQKKFYPEIMTGSKEEYITLKESLKGLCRKDRNFRMQEFKKTSYYKIRNSIFYQRPLKSVKKYVGKCRVEPSKRVCLKSSPLFQEFRILKQLADLRYTEGNSEPQRIPEEWRLKIQQYLETNEQLFLRGKKEKIDDIEYIKVPDIFDVLDIPSGSISFNFDNPDDDKRFDGNRTYSRIYKAVGDETYNLLKKACKLDKLWNLIIMKNDDDWLCNLLIDKQLWPELNDEMAIKLSEIVLEIDRASYSKSALSKIIPLMRTGMDEFDVKDKLYKKVKARLKSKISQPKNGEMRSPVVSKAVSVQIRSMNTMIEKHKMPIGSLSAVIENTRELTKPKEYREQMRHSGFVKNKEREDLVAFLNSKTNLGRQITIKDKGIIRKYELWLELPVYGSEKMNPKNPKYNIADRECVFSGKKMPLNTLFKPSTHEAHIWGNRIFHTGNFDDVTIADADVNYKMGTKTSFEFMKDNLKDFKERIKRGNFSKTKKEKFLTEKIPSDFSTSQLNDTAYIAKYMKSKIEEVSSDVRYSPGKVTYEFRKIWGLNNILDVIIYEEATGIDIDEHLSRLHVLKKYFNQWRKDKGKSIIYKPEDWLSISDNEFEAYKKEKNDDIKYVVDEVSKFYKFINFSENKKKSRRDHRHHMVDAITNFYITPKMIDTVARENVKYNGNGMIYYSNSEPPFDRKEIKEILKKIIIISYGKDGKRLFVSKKNKGSKTKSGEIQKTYSVRASLTKDGNLGKLKNPLIRSGIPTPHYVSRNGNDICKFKDQAKLDTIYDESLSEIIKRRHECFKNLKIPLSDSSYEKFPLYRYSPIDIKIDPLEEITSCIINGNNIFCLKGYEDIWETHKIESIDEVHVNKIDKIVEFVENIDFMNPGLKSEIIVKLRKLIPVSKKGKSLPVIRTSRATFRFYNNVIELPNNRFAEHDGNYIMAIYEGKNKKGNIVKDSIVFTNYEVVKRQLDFKKTNTNNEKFRLFENRKTDKKGNVLFLSKDCPNLKKNDAVIMYTDDIDKKNIKWDDNIDLSKRLYYVTGINAGGTVDFIKHNIAEYDGKKETTFDELKPAHTLKVALSKLFAIKVRPEKIINSFLIN